MRAKLMLALTLSLAPLAACGGETLTPETVLASYGETDAYVPVAAFGKDIFLVVWRAGRNADADLVGLRLDKSGRALDAKPFVVSGAKGCQDRPRIVFGGGVFLVVWHDMRNGKDWDVYAARVMPAGKVLDPDGIAVSTEKHNQAQPAVCFDRNAFQLVWRDFRDGSGYDLFGGRVGADGRPLDGAGVPVLKRSGSDTSTKETPAVGTNGKGQVLAVVRGIRGRFKIVLMREGKPAEVQDSVYFSKNSTVYEPLLASDGRRYLLTFTTLRPVSLDRDATVASGALLLDPAAPPVQKGKETQPSIALTSRSAKYSLVRNSCPAWDGKSYVVSWDTFLGDARGAPRYDRVLLRRVSADGKALGTDVPVAGEEGRPAHHPAVASDGKGTTLIAYERHPRTGDVPIKIAFRMLKGK